MPTEVTLINGKWLDSEQELLVRCTELFAATITTSTAADDGKDHVSTTNDENGEAALTVTSSQTTAAAVAVATALDNISPDLATAADGLLSLGIHHHDETLLTGAHKLHLLATDADVPPIMDEPSSSNKLLLSLSAAAAAVTKSKKRSSYLPFQESDTVAAEEQQQQQKPAKKKKKPTTKKKKYTPKQCRIPNCTKLVQSKSLCISHGAILKRCNYSECTNRAVKGGVCKRHGAVVERKKCCVQYCTNIAVRGGVCMRHGANKFKSVNNSNVGSVGNNCVGLKNGSVLSNN